MGWGTLSVDRVLGQLEVGHLMTVLQDCTVMDLEEVAKYAAWTSVDKFSENWYLFQEMWSLFLSFSGKMRTFSPKCVLYALFL